MEEESMTGRREKPHKAEDEQKQKEDSKPANDVKELNRLELEELRQMLQRKYHQ
jgi:hypothetical protein